MLQYIEHGQLKGPSAKIFKMLMHKIGIETKVEFYPWARAYNNVLTQPNTLILSITRTKERESSFIWLLKVNESKRAFISLKSNAGSIVNNIEQAKNKLIGVTRDSYSYTSLVENGFTEEKNLYDVSTVDEGINLLKKGKVDLIYTDPEVMDNHYNDIGKNKISENLAYLYENKFYVEFKIYVDEILGFDSLESNYQKKIWHKKYSKVHGHGLFASTIIKKGTRIIEYIATGSGTA